MSELKEEIGKRLELLHHQIDELVEKQKATERQLRAYRELVRHYHAVYEAEHGLGMQGQLEPEMIEKLERIITETEPIEETTGFKSMPSAVLEILTEKADAMHASEISKLVVERYPAVKERIKDIQKRVVISLIRGVQQGLYERVARNTYKLKKGKP